MSGGGITPPRLGLATVDLGEVGAVRAPTPPVADRSQRGLPGVPPIALPSQLGLAVHVISRQAAASSGVRSLLGVLNGQAPVFAPAQSAPLAAQNVESEVVPLMPLAAAEAVLDVDSEICVGQACAAMRLSLDAKALKPIRCKLCCAGIAFGGFGLRAAAAGFDDALAAPSSIQNVGSCRLPLMPLRAPKTVCRCHAEILAIEALAAARPSCVMQAGQIARLEIRMLCHAASAQVQHLGEPAPAASLSLVVRHQ